MKKVYTNEEINQQIKDLALQIPRKSRKFEFIVLDPTGVEVEKHEFSYTGGYGNRILAKFDEQVYVIRIDGEYISRLTKESDKLKLFKCTIETYPNNCYVETLLIVAENEEDAEEQIIAKRRYDDRNSGRIDPKYYIKYTSAMQEVKIDLSKKGILKVGFGHGDSDYGGDD